MTNPKQLIETSDWIISIGANANLSVGLSIGGQSWNFFSPRLHYACVCIVPRLGAGLSLEVALPGGAITSLVDQQTSSSFHMDQEHVTVLRPFSANSLDGGSIGSFSVGARGVVAGAEGHQTRVTSRAGHDIVRVRGGSVSAGLGVGVNMGTITIGTIYGPYEVRPPIMKAARTG